MQPHNTEVTIWDITPPKALVGLFYFIHSHVSSAYGVPGTVLMPPVLAMGMV